MVIYNEKQYTLLTMNITQIETNLQDLITSFDKENFIYDLLLAYGLPKASITRLRKGCN